MQFIAILRQIFYFPSHGNHIPSYVLATKTLSISPLPPTFPRKNSYQNQIDYILLRKNMNSKIFDSRSFNSNIWRSDHKPVIVKIWIKWTYAKKAMSTKIFQLKHITKYANTWKLHGTSKQNNKNQINITSNQEEWNNIIKALKASAETNLGYNHKEKKSRDPNIVHL